MLDSDNWFSGTVIESDVSGWDWTVQECELLHAGELRISLIHNCPKTLARVIRGRYHCMLHKLLCLSNGETFVGPVGIMASGSYLTSSDNSHMRATLGLRARYNLGVEISQSLIKCVGDDCVEEDDVPVEALRSEYERLGHKIKDIRVSSSDDFELCSHRFDHGTPRPLTVAKSVYKWAQGSRGGDQTEALIEFTRNIDATTRQKVLSIISQYGGAVKDSHEQTTDEEELHEADARDAASPAEYAAGSWSSSC